jgi:soluble lytic murein transglycosylase
MPSFWAKNILGRCYSAGRFRCAALAAWVALYAASPGGLKPLVRAYRSHPTPQAREAVASYAAANPSESALAKLALGIAAYEQKTYPEAIANLQGLTARLPRIADYAAYYLAAARVESNGFDGVPKELSAVHAVELPSPLAAKAWVLEARALEFTAPSEGIRILREHYAALPQPEGDLALADCYQAARDLPNAAVYYQRVYYQYPAGDPATKAATALAALKNTMGAAYPNPTPRQMLMRGDKLLDLRNYADARAEFEAASSQGKGFEQDQARVRLGVVDLRSGKTSAAYLYLNGLAIPESEADAERLYYVEESARQLNNEDAMMGAVRRLSERYTLSPWRLKALVDAASRFAVTNRPSEFIPLYKAAYEAFPKDPAAGNYHWKIAFQAYLHDQSDAVDLLREQLRKYPKSATAGAALYFLGRSAERKNGLGAAHAYYERLARALPNTYYAMLARDRLRQPDVKNAVTGAEAAQFLSTVEFPAAKTLVTQSTHATAVRIERSRLLRAAGLADLAEAELRFGALTDAQPSLVAMEFAAEADAPYQGLHFMKSFASDYLNLEMSAAPRKFWEYLFPAPYRAELFADARAHGLDPYLVAGLIRQESEFNPEAVSRANADGLMQVRPGTGRDFARRAGIPRFSPNMLFQPQTNLKIGTMVLRSMLDQQGGSVEQTLAAYNAGPRHVGEWLSWNQYREPAEFVESIPFPETRDYVQAVLRNAEMYRRLYP